MPYRDDPCYALHALKHFVFALDIIDESVLLTARPHRGIAVFKGGM